MSEKRIYLTSEIRKLSDVNKRYIELEMVVSNTLENLNGIVTTPEFLRKRYDTLITMPLQVDKVKLEAGLVNSLTHQWDGETLNTQTIGTFTEAWLETSQSDEDEITMIAKARVYKRYPKTVEAIKQLYEDEDLKFSWELLATEVEEVDGVGYIYDGEFEGHCIVSQPAYPDAVATKLVAEAFAKDVSDTHMSDQNKEGGESIDMEKTLTLAEILKEKSIDEVRAEITNAIRATLDLEKQGAYVYDMYPSQVVAEIYSTETWEGEFYRISYTLSENEISVDMESKSELARVWVDKSDLESTEEPMVSEAEGRKLSEKTELVSELETKISELEEKLQSQAEETVVESTEEETETETEVEVAEATEVEGEVETEPTEKDVELAETVIALSERLEKAESEIEILKPYKEKVLAEEEAKKQAQEEANKTRLSEMVEKFIEEDEEGNKQIPEEVQTFISEMDETSIKLWIANKVVEARLTSEVDGENDDNDDPIVVETPEEEDLVEEEEEFELY